MRTRTKLLLTFVILVPTISIGLYVVALKSQSYAAARSAIQTAPAVRLAVGDVQRVRLGFFGYRVRVSDSNGEAIYYTSVKGATGTAGVRVALSLQEGRWMVRSLTTDR